jgi:ABC-2 type transport system ATP-binding protein
MCAASGLPSSRVDEVLAEVGITTVADQRVGGFSLGMRQRLALAGALLGEPETLLLDEPANGLDPDGIRWLRSYLRGYAERGGAVFVSSHLIAELALFADDLVVIGAGRLLAAAPVDEVVNDAERSVLIETPQRDELIVLLRGQGIGVSEAGHRINVTGASRSDVAQLALDHHIRLDELVDHQASLEDLLVELTQTAAEFTAA